MNDNCLHSKTVCIKRAQWPFVSTVYTCLSARAAFKFH